MYPVMEGVPFFPEAPDDDEESKAEKKDSKDSKDKKLSIFDKLIKGAAADEEKPKKGFELFKDDKTEKTDNAEQDELPLEQLATDEKQQAAEQYVQARTSEVEQELGNVPDGTPAEAAVLANAALLENIQEKLDADQPLDAGLLDETLTETLNELGLDTSGAEETPEDVLAETIAETEETQPDDTAVPTAVPPTSPPVVPPPAVPPAANTGGVGLPPIPPVTFGVPAMPGVGLPNMNTVPNSTPEVVQVRSRRREAANVLVGGIVGYMVGRRGGRLRTEAKLLPVQEKLKKEVAGLHDQIGLREEKIRKLTYAQTAEQPARQERVIERVEKRAERNARQQSRAPENSPVFDRVTEPRLHTSERFKSVETMTIPELIAIAERIEIQQSSAKRLFETGRLDAEGLRHIVRSYLRGERLEPVLRERLKTPEIHQNPETLQTSRTTNSYNREAPMTSVASLIQQQLQNPAQHYDRYKLPADYRAARTSAKKPAAAPLATAAVTGIVIGLLIVLLIIR